MLSEDTEQGYIKFCFYILQSTFQLPLFKVFYWHGLFSPFQISPSCTFQSSITKPVLLCKRCLCVSFWPALVMSAICTCLWSPAAISADSHVCSGLLSRVEKQLGVNREKIERLHTRARPLSKLHQITLFIFFSASIGFTVKRCCIISPTISGEMLDCSRNSSPEFWDKFVLFSMQAKPFTQGQCRVFICEQQFHLAVLTPVSEIQ